MRPRFLFLVIGLVAIMPAAAAQINISLGEADLHTGKIGLGLDGITGSNTILMKYFFNNRLAGELIFGFEMDVPGGEPSGGETKVTGRVLTGGVGILYHLTGKTLTPYIGAEVLYTSSKEAGFYSEEPDPRNSIVAAVILGGEYFFGAQFSLGLKQAIGVEMQLKRDSPREDEQTLVATTTVFTGRYYFN